MESIHYYFEKKGAALTGQKVDGSQQRCLKERASFGRSGNKAA